MIYPIIENTYLSKEKIISDFMDTLQYEKILENYIKTCQVKPKNIYTEQTDFKKRYFLELNILSDIFSNIDFPNNIGSQIPELNDFFPVVETIRERGYLQNKKSIEYIFLRLNEYFSVINTREYGEYYSNDKLINILLENLEIEFSNKLKVIDPACGAGFFLFNYLKRLLNSNPKSSDLANIQENIYGYDIFPFPIIISKLILGKLIESFDSRYLNPYLFRNIKIQNTLKTLSCISDNSDKFDLIIGNPPYFRIDPHEENNICKCVSYGHNYIHSLFLHWCTQHLQDNGELGLILPQSILSGFYYQKLRNELISNISIELIVTNKDHEKSFSVQQDIMIFLGKKAEKQSKNYDIGVSNVELTSITRYSVSSKILKNSLKVVPLFKDKSEFENFDALSKKEIVKHLALFKIKTGNFVWNQNKEICYSSQQPDTIPLINGPNITLNGIELHNKRNTTFPYCKPNKTKYIKKEKLLLYRRMSPIGNIDRMVASIIDIKDERFANGYVLENHVNFISGPSELLYDLLKFITTPNFNKLINSFCHTNQVSSNDLMTIFELLESYNHD